MRVLRSKRLRYRLWKAQNGFCAICNEPMGNDFHIDHKIAVARGGRTVRENLQAVCKRCNLQKGANMALKYLKRPDQDHRQQTLLAIELARDRYQQGEVSTAMMFPPRWGKSTVIRGLALELRAIGAPTSIMLAPWDLLAEQIKDADDIRDMYKRYRIPHETAFTSHRLKALQTDEWWNLVEGVPTLLSCTVGLAYRNKAAFLDGLKLLRAKCGKRVPVFLDECHLFKMLKNWGPFASEIIEAGGYLVPLTGTPVPGMPGFQEERKAWEEVTKTIKARRVVDGAEKWFKDTYAGKSGEVALKADIQVSWKEAWDCGALTRANGIWIDFDVTDKATGKLIGKLSQLTKDELSGNLRDIIESDECVDLGARVVVDRLLVWKRRNRKAKALVITGFDYDADGHGGHNRHARALKTAIEDYIGLVQWDDRIRVEIATGVTQDGEPDKDATEKIKAFRKGNIDVLIVKMMGLVGLDAPPLKVLGYMGVPRQGPLSHQALSRVLTTWKEMAGKAADIIMPQDARMVECWQRMIEEQGGLASSDMVLVDSVEVEQPQAKEDADFSISNGAVAGYINEDGREARGDHEVLLRVIKEKYHVGDLTDAEIIENYEKKGYEISDIEIDAYKAEHFNGFTAIRDLDVDLPKLKGKFGQLAKDIVNKRINYGQKPVEWRAALEKVQSRAKEFCRVHVDVPKIHDAALLRKLIDALPHAERAVFGNG